MQKYVQHLDLNFDPFESISDSEKLFPGGGRQALLEQLVRDCRDKTSIVAITGPLGSGKSTLSRCLTSRMEEIATVVCVQATLFMSQQQILEEICAGLDIGILGSENAESLTRLLLEYTEKNIEPYGTLQIIVDDAHELGDDALDALLRLTATKSSIVTMQMLLLGEAQLITVLDEVKSKSFGQLVVENYELSSFSSEDALDYVRFKLDSSGYKGKLPLSISVIGEIYNRSNGVPGTINALVRDELELKCELQPVNRHYVPPAYWATAAGLVLILLAIVFVIEDDGTDLNSLQVELPPVQAEAGIVEIPLELPLLQTDGNVANQPVPAELTAVVQPTLQVRVEDLVEVVQPAIKPLENLDGNRPQTTPASENSAANIPVAAVTPAPMPTPATPATTKTPVALDPHTAYERKLLSFNSGNYALQVLGSSSETNVQKFITDQGSNENFTYFESRFQGRPWFVVVYGNYRDKTAATSAAAVLPQRLKELQPWARTIADIQSEIKKFK